MSFGDDSYGRQIGILNEFSEGLGKIANEAQVAREEYRRLLDVARSSGFMTDYTDKLGGELFAEFSRQADELLALVVEERSRIPGYQDILSDLRRGAGHDK